MNYIAAAALIVIGAVADFYVPGSGSSFYAWAAALVKSPVQAHRGRDGYYVSYGYGGFRGDTRSGPMLTTGGGGTPPPMTAPAGAVSFALPVVPQWAVDEFAAIGDVMTLGLTRLARDAWGIGSVDTSSSSYQVGYWGATVAGVVASGGTSLYMRASVGGVRSAAPAAAKGLGANPFKGKTAKEIAEMLEKKGYVPKGPDPAAGRGTYVNPKTGRGYHIDASHPEPKGPHVGVHRPRDMRDTLDPRDYPIGNP